MSFYRKIVVAVDATPQSECAVGVGISLAHIDGGSVVFAVAIDPAIASPECGFAAFAEIARERARGLLDRALERAAIAAVPARGEIFVDHAAEGLLKLVRSEDAGLLIVGQTPRRTMFEPFIANLVEYVLRKSTVPVCAVRRPARGFLTHRILVPLADDDLHETAISYAVALAKDHGSAIVFATVDSGNAPARDLLAQALRYAGERGVEATACALESRDGVVTAICERAEIESCDAIVMASHGRDGWPRLIAGSVAEALIKSSNVPVIAVRKSA